MNAIAKFLPGGASLSIGLGIVMDALLVHHKPFTMLDTAYGSEFRAPREAGSSVAQFGMADRDRRVVCDDDNLATAAAGPKRLPVVVSSNIWLY